MRDQRQNPRRGAAILLALSLLTVMALLGTTFLVVTQSYRDHSAIIEAREPVEELAAGIVRTVCTRMQDDLWLSENSTDTNGYPYKSIRSGKPPDVTVRRRYGEFPGKQARSAYADRGEDFWLSTFDVYEKNVSGGAAARAANLGLGTYAPTVELLRPKFNAISGGYVSSSGIEEKDGVWQGTSVYNVNGEQYYVALRVLDLCGLMNVNTAGRYPDWDNPPLFMTSLDLDIAAVFSGVPGVRSRIETERQSEIGTPAGRKSYFWNVASRLHTPDGARPFCIGDEPAARIPHRANQKLRLSKMFSNISDYHRTHATAYSCNRNFLRFNNSKARQRINPNVDYLLSLKKSDGSRVYPANALRELDIAGEDENDQRAREIREGLYVQIKNMIAKKDHANKAKHIVANLWAYCDGMNPDKDYAFAPPGGGVTVYGVVPRPVIAEVFIYHKKDTLVGDKDPDGTKDDSVKAYAVEIFNPTDAGVDLSEYTLGGMSLSGTVGVGQRMVFYHHEAGLQASADDRDVTKVFQGASTAGWISLPELDFSTDKMMKLKKGSIPIDVIKTSDLGYMNKNFTFIKTYKPMAAGRYGPKSMQRDDTWDDPSTPFRYEGRERYNVAFYITFSNNKLGMPNNLAGADMPRFESKIKGKAHDGCYEGFSIRKKRKVINASGEVHYVCQTVGELFHLYWVGPTKGGRSLPEQLKARRCTRDRGKCVPDSESDDIYEASDDYAKIPWPLCLAEFVDVVPPDPFRDLSDVPGRDVYAVQYGKININTAPAKVLRGLPFPPEYFWFGADINDGTFVSDEESKEFRSLNSMRSKAVKIVEHRRAWSGLKSIGQVLNGRITGGTKAYIRNIYNGRHTRIGMVDVWVRWGRILDLLTINSDSFAVILKISSTNNSSRPQDSGGNVVGEWRYLAVIDRSNCLNPSDRPQIMLFMPLD
ncbi:MAG: hypothetical protein HN370_07800 [Phycisphaerales bacterium]|jgi:hypothetical protein|nr:hypothetical protein [Phycisphaerales bacterium]